VKKFQSQTRSGFGFGSSHTGRRPARSSGGRGAAPVTRYRSPVTCGHCQLRNRQEMLVSWGEGAQHAALLADARWGDRQSQHRANGGCPDARGGGTDQGTKKAEAPQRTARPERGRGGRSRTYSTRSRVRPHTARGGCGSLASRWRSRRRTTPHCQRSRRERQQRAQRARQGQLERSRDT